MKQPPRQSNETEPRPQDRMESNRNTSSKLGLLPRLVIQPFNDVMASMEPIMLVHPFRAMGSMLIALIATWFIYVPIHELLHVAGCLITGGRVTTLQIKPIYFGHQLARIFDFVEAGGSYAGRLSDFDWRGSDLIYLATDFGPFLLTVIVGVPLLRLCTRRRHPLMFGSAVVVGLAPFYNIPGDYFEMGSIMTTRLATWITGATEVAYAGIRSDDVFALIGKLFLTPNELGLHGAGEMTIAAALTLVSLSVAIMLAFSTYVLGHIMASVVVGAGRLPDYKREKNREPST